MFKKITLLFTLPFFLFAQNDSTQYSSTETPTNDIVSSTISIVTIPLLLGTIAISIIPPSFGVKIEEGGTKNFLEFQTGIGLGRRIQSGIFSDMRLQFGYVHFFQKSEPDFWRAEFHHDIHFDFIDKRKLFLFGMSPSVGINTNFSSSTFSVGGSLWLMTPQIPFLGFFPLHTFGITYRYNTDFSQEKFHTISLGISSAIVFRQ